MAGRPDAPAIAEPEQLRVGDAMLERLRALWHRPQSKGNASPLSKGGDPFLKASVVHQEGMDLWRAGQLDQALERFQEALRMKERIANRSASASSIHMIGVVYAQKRDWANATRFMLMSLEIDAEDGHDDGVAKSLNDIATMMGSRGDEAAKQRLVQLGNRLIAHFGRGPRLELNEVFSLCDGLPGDLATVKTAVTQLLRRGGDNRRSH